MWLFESNERNSVTWNRPQDSLRFSLWFLCWRSDRCRCSCRYRGSRRYWSHTRKATHQHTSESLFSVRQLLFKGTSIDECLALDNGLRYLEQLSIKQNLKWKVFFRVHRGTSLRQLLLSLYQCLKFFAKNIHQQRSFLIFLYLNFHNMFQPKTGSSSGDLIIWLIVPMNKEILMMAIQPS